MSNHKQVTKAFLNGKKAKGYAMFTDGRAVYSWGYHHVLAVQYRPDIVLINPDKVSVSTSRHLSMVRAAVPASWVLEVPGLSADTSLADKATKNAILDYHLGQYHEAKGKASKARSEASREAWERLAAHHYEQHGRTYRFASEG